MLEVSFHKTVGNFSLHPYFQSSQGVLGILGSSGCGKSLTLKSIAGLYSPDEGYIRLNGRELFNSDSGINIPPRKRNIGYVFQNYALFPHLTVNQNIVYGINHLEKGKQQQKVNEMIERMQLSGLEDRYPAKLSGGQQQRVALARTLITEPELLLLDEPFSALDSHIKRLLENDLLNLIRNNYNGIVLLVTHNIEEAYRLCDRIAIFEKGKTLQIGDKEAIISSPANVSAARITGCNNFLNAAFIKEEDDYYILQSNNLVFKTVKKGLPEASKLIAGIRANDLRLATELSEEINTFHCEVLEKIEGVFANTAIVNCLGNKLKIEIPKHVWPHLSNCHCQQLMLHIPPDKVFLMGEDIE